MKKLTCKIAAAAIGLLMVSIVASAQQIKGVVTDGTGEPLIGVSVFVEGTTIGAVTGLDGDYVLDVPDAKGKTLVFSYIGMATQYITIGNAFVIDVELNDDSTYLEETVVIGYATVKRRDLMGSVSSVDNAKLTEVPVASVSEALSGKLAGVQVTTTEGDPDAEINIRVRGTGSITQDSSPLYIVDGFPVESISDIPSSDIQSIDVLKDAFSTAIYGSRGANGVILVTTKSGSKDKLTVSYNAYYGLKWMTNSDAIEVESPYDFVRTQYELATIRGTVDDDYIPTYGVFADIDLYQNIEGNDWIKQVFGRTGHTFSHNVSVSGATDKVKWTASYAHINEKAIMVGSNYRRDNLSFKANFKPIKEIEFDFNTRYSYTVVEGAGANSINDSGSTSGNGRLKHAVQYTPIPITSGIADDLEESYGDNAPPLQSVADNDKYRTRSNWTVNASVTWHIIDNLDLKVEGGMDDYNQATNQFYGLTTYYVGNTATYKDQPAEKYTHEYRTKYRSTNTLHYNFEDLFSDNRHKLDVLLGLEYIVTKSNEITMLVENFPEFFDSDMARKFMSSGTAVSSNNYYDPDDKLLSYFARVNYSYDDRYSFSATVRADGSSKFAEGNQWGFFPSAAVSWTISNEKFIRNMNLEWLNNLKLRYSYGTAGNNNIPSGVQALNFAAYTNTYTSQSTVYWAPTTSDGKSIMPNEDLTWETTKSHNIGLDWSLFRTKLNGSFEFYHNTTDDLLIQFPVSGSGYDYQYRNMGSVRNMGFEATINAVLVEKKNWGLTFSGNISINDNEVTSLGGLESISSSSGWASTEISTDYLVTAGQPLGNIYGYKYDGFYTTEDFTYDTSSSSWVANEGTVDASAIVGSKYFRPGSVKFKDLNGDGEITTDDMTVIGNALAKGSGGFSLSGTVYNFDFSANFTFQYGNDVYNANKIEFTSSRKYSNRNLLSSVSPDNAWTNIDWTTGEEITDAATLEAVNAGKTTASPAVGYAILSDAAIEDGSFLRLSSATIGYTLPSKLTKKIHMQKFRVYVSGTNLLLITGYSGYDPEVSTRRSTPLTPGVDYSAYPKSIGVVAGVNITF